MVSDLNTHGTWEVVLEFVVDRHMALWDTRLFGAVWTKTKGNLPSLGFV